MHNWTAKKCTFGAMKDFELISKKWNQNQGYPSVKGQLSIDIIVIWNIREKT